MVKHFETRKWLNSLQLMRIPFSVFLMPVYWFALLNVEVNFGKAVLVFLTLHLFVYPASNGYNSYFDRDEKSIGGLRNPPRVTKELWYLVILFDFCSLLIATWVGFPFSLMIFVYILMSKAYSWKHTRLKKYPIPGAFTVITFQGFWTYLSVQVGVSESEIFSGKNLLLGLVSSLFLLGSYPITQIYQHKEDSQRGDHSLSLLLGIKGTFVFSAIVFFFASVLLVTLFLLNDQWLFAVIYILSMAPVNWYFLGWFSEYRRGIAVITFERTMKLNAMSSLLLTSAFLLMLFLK